MHIEVAYVDPEREALVALDVAPATTVEQAVAQSMLIERIGLPRAMLAFAIFGRRVDPQARLADGDRVEITRPLACDPMLARRRRASRKG